MPRPCNECPWRRRALPGWLGNQSTPEEWVERAKSDRFEPCHLSFEEGAEDDDRQPCTGIAIFRANIGKLPRLPHSPVMKPERKSCFATGEEFITHHRQHGKTSAEIHGGDEI